MSTADILGQQLCAFAFCWRLERRDGVTIGLTSHDRALRVRGLDYSAAPGITPSAILRGGDPREDLAEVQGGISSAAISESDLDAGRWDGARAMLHLTEWTEPGVLWLELACGTLGGATQSGQTYSVALQGLGGVLGRPVTPSTSPTCRATLGDALCAVDLRPLRRIATVEEVEGERLRVADLLPGVYAWGSVRWLTGACAGLQQMIADQSGDVLTLAEPPPLPVAAGGRVALTQGCDRRIATCADRFGNAINFRGEPHLPGMDLLTRYPGA